MDDTHETLQGSGGGEDRLLRCYRYLLEHDGSGKLTVSMKILKRGQKEILIECGRTYRYVVDMPSSSSGD